MTIILSTSNKFHVQVHVDLLVSIAFKVGWAAVLLFLQKIKHWALA